MLAETTVKLDFGTLLLFGEIIPYNWCKGREINMEGRRGAVI
jgi:hypothetical protein